MGAAGWWCTMRKGYLHPNITRTVEHEFTFDQLAFKHTFISYGWKQLFSVAAYEYHKGEICDF